MTAIPDTTNIDTTNPFEALPPGEYLALAIDNEMRDTKSGTGQYLQITWEVLEGEHKGRKLWSRFNLVNQNQTAVDIALRELATLKEALGKPGATDADELMNVPVVLSVVVRQYQGEPMNDIRGYRSKDAPSSKPTPSAGTAMPWEK